MMEKYGLWYSLSGVALATAPESELALEMGAEISIRFGLVIPCKSREAVFAESAKRLRREKAKQDADKGGIKVLLDSDEEKERELMRPENQNRFMLDLFANRQPGQIIPRPSLMSLGEMVLNDWDLQTVDTKVRLNMEYDFKRRPVDARMVRIESLGVEHLAFATVRDNAAEGELARMLFDRWRQGEQDKDGNWVRPAHCLKTMADWTAWQAFYGLYAGNHQRRARFQALLDASETTESKPDSGPGEVQQKRLRGPTG